jgi:invasion protein IalB
MSIRSLIAVCLILAVSQPLLAQTKPAAQKPGQAAAPKPPAASSNATSNADPQITATAFGDWSLRCQSIPNETRKNCEVSLTVQRKDEPAPIAKIALGRPGPGSALRLLVLLPNNVSFPSTVQIKSDDKDVWSIDVPWERCIPGACFAETSLKDADLVRWRVLDTAGKISFKDAQTNEVGITISFHGLTQALDAFDRETQ